jgi:hypothetical protein
MVRVARLAVLALTVLTLSATASESRGQSAAYYTHGTGVFTPANGDYSGTGVGTHLGAQTFFGNVLVMPTGNPLVVTWYSTVPQVTIAANGDRLYFSSSGTAQLIPLSTPGTFTAIWTGDFVVVGGTGRFASAGPAAQPIQAVVVNDPFKLTDPVWTFTWELSGRIVLH